MSRTPTDQSMHDVAQRILYCDGSLCDSCYSKRALLENETTKCLDGIQKHFYNKTHLTLFNQNLLILRWFCNFMLFVCTQLCFFVNRKIINVIRKQIIATLISTKFVRKLVQNDEKTMDVTYIVYIYFVTKKQYFKQTK